MNKRGQKNEKKKKDRRTIRGRQRDVGREE